MTTSLVIASISLCYWSSSNQTIVFGSLQVTAMSVTGELELNPFPAAPTPIFSKILRFSIQAMALVQKTEMCKCFSETIRVIS